MTAKDLMKWAESLRNDTIDAQPIDKDWSGGYAVDRDDDGWRSWEPQECEKCGRVLALEVGRGGERHSELEEWIDAMEGSDEEPAPDPCDGHVPQAEGPMMNYWYPCPINSPEDAARILEGLPVCVVEVDGEMGLALTGGGMDLSWEICEAYTRLGYLPPIHYAGRLPKMADRLSDGKRMVLAAAKRAAEIRVAWAQRAVEEINDVEKWMKEQERKRAKGTK
jgi:hypothetical protein